jgi:hypothetical protein
MNSDAAPEKIEADRMALRQMFKAIAEFGRKVRLRRQVDAEASGQSAPPLRLGRRSAGRGAKPVKRRATIRRKK